MDIEFIADICIFASETASIALLLRIILSINLREFHRVILPRLPILASMTMAIGLWCWHYGVRVFPNPVKSISLSDGYVIYATTFNVGFDILWFYLAR
ncbi:hypothetical protein SFRURICE_003337 [Spodoptera frugiperda]|nr:hypothetical protein SFRURICE_003337 [Spodoptera frugiperda]